MTSRSSRPHENGNGGWLQNKRDKESLDRLQAEIERRRIGLDLADRERDRCRADVRAWRGVVEDVRSRLELDWQRLALERAQASADRLRAALELEQAALHRARAERDELTGALRRGAGMTRLDEEIVRARRTGTPLALSFVDVVGLKQTNDTAGHDAGDRLLQAVATACIARTRPYDLVIRYGGDEFVVVFAGATIEEAQRRCAEIEDSLRSSLRGARITAGLAALGDGDSAASLLARADHDLYRQRGRTAPLVGSRL